MQKKKLLATIDIGNSSTKYAFFENDDKFHSVLPTEIHRTRKPIERWDDSAELIIAEILEFLTANKKIVRPHKSATTEETLSFIAKDLPYSDHTLSALTNFRMVISNTILSKEKNLFLPRISNNLIRFAKEGIIEDIFISSVVPRLNDCFEKKVYASVGIKPTFISSSIAGIKSNYTKHLGADRVANIKAANILYPNEDIIIIDIGTATTIDIVNTDNIFLGGMILPGPKLFSSSLDKNTDVQSFISRNSMEEERFPIRPNTERARVETIRNPIYDWDVNSFPTELLGTNTSSAISSGIKHGYLAMIEKLISKIFQDQKKDFKILVTGGYQDLTEKLNLPTEPIKNINLTLIGIMCVYQHVKVKKHCNSSIQ